MSRQLNITITPKSGILHFFVARVAGKKVISAFANEAANWSGKVADIGVIVEVEAYGGKGAEYSVLFDLPGDANDITHNRTLPDGDDALSQTL